MSDQSSAWAPNRAPVSATETRAGDAPSDLVAAGHGSAQDGYLTFREIRKQTLAVFDWQPDSRPLHSPPRVHTARSGGVRLTPYPALDVCHQARPTIASPGATATGDTQADQLAQPPTEAVQALRQHKALQNEDRLAAVGWADYDLVFCTVAGTPLIRHNVLRAFRDALCRAGLPQSIHFHDLRHAHATNLLRAGVGIKTASW